MTVWAAEEPQETYSSQFVIAHNSPKIAPGRTFNPDPTEDGYCVSFVQQNGFSGLHGNANEWIKYIDPHTMIPQEGYAVVMSYGDIGHLGIFHNGELLHQNFEGRWIVSHWPLDKSRVIGYIPSSVYSRN